MRRGHGSSKVPNVKLRPARVSTKTKTAGPSNSAYDVAEEEHEISTCPRPFKNVVLCATGVNDKPTLFKQASELGATTFPDFTDRVTHLIACGPGSAKFKCALERKIPIMQPSWVTESYVIWLRGDDVDLEESINSHRLPIFSRVILALSGIDDLERRTKINKLVTEHGGTYVKNLERPVKVTHLLCAGSEETEKMKYARKFNSKGEARIHLIWEEWFWDSLHFGGQFDEGPYKMTRPRPNPKFRSEEPGPLPLSSTPSLHSLTRDPIPPALPSASLLTGDEPEELAAVKRIPAETMRMWESLLKPRGFSIVDGQLLRSPPKTKTSNSVALSPPSSPAKQIASTSVSEKGAAFGTGSIISSFRRTAQKDTLAPALDAPRQPFRRLISTASNPFDGPSERESMPPSRTPSVLDPTLLRGKSTSFIVPVVQKERESISELFVGRRFRVLGEANTASLRASLESYGGLLIPEHDEEVDFIVVRLVSGSKFYREEGDELERLKYRTECWLEQCMFQERICAPEENVVFIPLRIETPVSGAESISLSFSGLDQSEACWIRRLVRALGANIPQNFSRRSTHLLCPSRTGAKFDKAEEWGVPVVSMTWLSEIARTGVVPPVSDSVDSGGFAEVPEPSVDLKGKGKGREARMVDITAITNNSQTDEYPQNRSGSPNTHIGDAPPPSRSSSIKTETVHLDSSQDLTPFGSATGLLSSLSNPGCSNSVPLSRKASAQNSTTSCGRMASSREIEREMTRTRIPSSETPSPMKPPSSSSSVHPQLSESTKVLKDAFTSLLGKRLPSEEDERASRHGRGAKRPRPQQKQNSRQDSIVSSTNSFNSNVGMPYAQHSLSPFELPGSDDELNMIYGEGRTFDESMRVTYEDPAQREEKKRLMSLVGSQESPAEYSKRTTGKSLVRKCSTRMPGF